VVIHWTNDCHHSGKFIHCLVGNFVTACDSVIINLSNSLLMIDICALVVIARASNLLVCQIQWKSTCTCIQLTIDPSSLVCCTY
jgi:hypothetical protein